MLKSTSKNQQEVLEGSIYFSRLFRAEKLDEIKRNFRSFPEYDLLEVAAEQVESSTQTVCDCDGAFKIKSFGQLTEQKTGVEFTTCSVLGTMTLDVSVQGHDVCVVEAGRLPEVAVESEQCMDAIGVGQ
jgi:hypothetical protein